MNNEYDNNSFIICVDSITYLGNIIDILDLPNGFTQCRTLGKSFISKSFGEALELASTYIENSILTQKSL